MTIWVKNKMIREILANPVLFEPISTRVNMHLIPNRKEILTQFRPIWNFFSKSNANEYLVLSKTFDLNLEKKNLSRFKLDVLNSVKTHVKPPSPRRGNRVVITSRVPVKLFNSNIIWTEESKPRVLTLIANQCNLSIDLFSNWYYITDYRATRIRPAFTSSCYENGITKRSQIDIAIYFDIYRTFQTEMDKNVPYVKERVDLLKQENLNLWNFVCKI